MRKTLELYWLAFNTALQAKFEYRVDFVLGVVTSLMLQMAALAFLFVVFHQTPDLQGWTSEQVVFLFGLTAASLGASELLFNHIWMVPYYVVKGDLDRLLTYPVDSLSFLLVTKPELHSFGNLITGFALTGAALLRLEAPWYAWLLLPLGVLLGCVIYTSSLVIAAAFSFKFMGPTSLHLMIPHTLLQATRYPLSIYPGWLKFGLMFLVPYGAFSYFPAAYLLGKDLAPWMAAVALLSVLFFILAARKAWKWGLSRYESTGS